VQLRLPPSPKAWRQPSCFLYVIGNANFFSLPFFRGFGILISKKFGEKGMFLSWHTLLIQNALVVVLVKENAQYLQLVKATDNS